MISQEILSFSLSGSGQIKAVIFNQILQNELTQVIPLLFLAATFPFKSKAPWPSSRSESTAAEWRLQGPPQRSVDSLQVIHLPALPSLPPWRRILLIAMFLQWKWNGVPDAAASLPVHLSKFTSILKQFFEALFSGNRIGNIFQLCHWTFRHQAPWAHSTSPNLH